MRSECGLGADWVRIGCELGADWVRIGCGLGADWMRIGCGLGADWVRIVCGLGTWQAMRYPAGFLAWWDDDWGRMGSHGMKDPMG